MKAPENDVTGRTPIWDCLQDLYMDTDVTLSHECGSRVCGQSEYSLKELEEILFNKVLPALTFNMFNLFAPEWTGLETQWLVKCILQKHHFGKHRP